MRIYTPHPKIIIIFPLSNICLVCIKETSPGDVSLTQPKHMFYRLLFK